MRITSLLLWACLPSLTLATTFEGRVVGVSDGDTITVLSDSKQPIKVRLAQIDAPEKRQAFGMVSKQALSDKVFNKRVTIEYAKADRYGRTIGNVLVDGLSVNLDMVKTGMAWVYKQYASDQAYYAAEERAKTSKIGLWSDAHPIPPWEFRHGGAKSNPSNTPALNTSNASCQGKRYCKQMTDCAEATFYLTQCGLKSLDKDGDGSPCESLCK